MNNEDPFLRNLQKELENALQAEAQGGATRRTSNNIMNNIRLRQAALVGARGTASTGTTPVKSRKRSRPARAGPSPNPRTPSNNRARLRQEAQKRMHNAEQETVRLNREVARLRANAAGTRRRVRSAKNKNVKQKLANQARRTNAEANRLNIERRRVQNSINNLFAEVMAFPHWYPPSGKLLKTPKTPAMSPSGVQLHLRLRKELKTITPSKPRARNLRGQLGIGPPVPRRGRSKPPSPVGSKNANSNKNESTGNKNTNTK